MSDIRPTPETDAFIIAHFGFGPTDHQWRQHARKLERERDEAREEITSSAINTNVRLFDLVRYSRASLHQDELITDEEYAWLCGGCEMANSPQGGSPSPRRLEDYDELRKQLEAMREAIKEAWIEIQFAEAGFAGLALRVCPNDSAVESVLNRMTEALAKLQPFLKP